MHIQKEVWMLMQTSKYHLQAPFKSQARRGRFFDKKDHITEIAKKDHLLDNVPKKTASSWRQG
jgi:hypothetical protein